MKGTPLATAIGCAIERERHRLHDAPPLILDDALAHRLIAGVWRDRGIIGEPPNRARLRALFVARQRYAEDVLASGEFTQYVILGAGLDSFAWRRADLMARLRVVELDLASVIEWKRQRIEDFAMRDVPERVFVACDLAHDSLDDALAASGFERDVSTFFAALGLLTYLAPAAIERVFAFVASCGEGSEIVASYSPARGLLDDAERALRAAQTQRPPAYLFEPAPAEIAALATGCGLEVVEDVGGDDLAARYFANRADGLRPSRGERLMRARLVRRLRASGKVARDAGARNAKLSGGPGLRALGWDLGRGGRCWRLQQIARTRQPLPPPLLLVVGEWVGRAYNRAYSLPPVRVRLVLPRMACPLLQQGEDLRPVESSGNEGARQERVAGPAAIKPVGGRRPYRNHLRELDGLRVDSGEGHRTRSVPLRGISLERACVSIQAMRKPGELLAISTGREQSEHATRHRPRRVGTGGERTALRPHGHND